MGGNGFRTLRTFVPVDLKQHIFWSHDASDAFETHSSFRLICVILVITGDHGLGRGENDLSKTTKTIAKNI